MKWRAFSETGVAALRQLAVDRKAWVGRTGKIVHSLQTIRGLREPAAIPALIGFLVDDDATVAKEAAAALQELVTRVPLALFPMMDERIRADSYWGFPGGPRPLTPGNFSRLQLGDDAAVSLGLASCHGSGYVRELAVKRLDREVLSGREMPFLLLRLNDWVSAVRAAAERAIARRLDESHRAAYLENLPIFVRMRNRCRTADSTAFAKIEHLMQGDLPALVSAAIAASDRTTQRIGLALALETARTVDDSAPARVVKQALKSDNPAVRFQAACWLADAKMPSGFSRRFLPELLDDRFVAVRRVALCWCAARDPRAHLANLRAALLDGNCTVRAIAQFHLPKLEPTDLRNFYRETVCQRDPANLRAALGGLGEVGRGADAHLILPLVDAHEVGVRKAALAALAKLALEEHVEIFVQALQADSPGVSRQARCALESQAARIGGDRLAVIFASAPHLHIRIQTLSLINRLSKWVKLPLLIEVFGQDEDVLRRTAGTFLRSWLVGFNRTHSIQPTIAEIARLRAVLAAKGEKLDRGIARELRALL